MSSNNQPLSNSSITPLNRSSLNSLLTNIVLDSDTGQSSFLISTGGQRSLYIDNYANVAINHSSPASQLDINSANGSCLTLRYNGGSNLANLLVSSNGQLTIAASGNEINTTSNLNIKSHNGSTGGLYLNNTLITATASQLNYTNVTAGTATASKAVILDSSKNFTGAGTISATNLGGVLTTAAQPNITSVGTLTTLSVTGDLSLSGNLIVGGSSFSSASMGYTSGLTPGTALPSKALVLDSGSSISGITTISATNLVGLIQTPSQPNITTLGNLNSLNVNGVATFTSNTDSSSSVSGSIIISGGVGIAKNLYVGTNIYGSIGTASQPNITSVGTLTGLTINGITNITNSTEATSNNTGALIVSGGIGINKNMYIGGNAVISGNLTVAGTTTSIYSTVTNISDNTIILNSGPAGSGYDSGFLVQRYQVDNNSGAGDVVNDSAKLSTTIASATSTTITLNVGASTTAGYYNNWWIKITSGTGNNQVRKVTSYSGATLILTLSSALSPLPSNGDNISLFNKGYSGFIWQESTKTFISSYIASDSSSTVSIIDYANLTIGAITSNAITASTSATTGAITLSGGIGINNTTDASSSTNGGALTIAGGVAIAKNLYIGTNVIIGSNTLTSTMVGYMTNITPGTASTSKALILDGSSNISGIATLSATNLSGTITTAAQPQITSLGTLTTLTVSSTITIGSSTLSSTLVNYLSGVTVGTASANKALILDASSNITGIATLSATNLSGTITTASQSQITSLGTLTTLTVSGAIISTASTASTTTTTGAIITSGGIGVAGSINVGGTLTATGNITGATLYGTIGTSTQNSITSIGTLTSLSSSGAVSFTAGTSSTSTTTGTLVITGGIGISGAAYIGTSLNVNGVTFGSTQAAYLTSITPGAVSASKAIVVDNLSNVTGLNTLSVAAITLNGADLQTTINNNVPTALQGVTAGTATANKALIVDGTKNIAGISTLSASAITLNGTDLQTTINNNTPTTLQGVTAGTVTANKALVVDGSKNISTIGTLTAATLIATTLTGTLSSGPQSGISAIGTLSNLTLSGNNDAISITNTTASGNTNIKFTNDNRSWEIGLKGSTAAAGAVNGIYIYDNANALNRLVINSSGNVGINTTSPSYRLDVSGTLNASTYYSGGTIMNTAALTSVTAGTAAANKALILDGSSNIISINALTAAYLYGAISTPTQSSITAVGILTSLSSSGVVTFTSSLDATSSSAGGALTVTGGAAIGANLYVGTGIYGSIKTASQPLITTVGTLTNLTVSGTISFTNTTDATGNNDGALLISGGVNIAKKLYVLNGIYGTISTPAQSTITSVGTLTSLSSSGAVTFTAGTASSSTSTGTLVVTGGIGISGAMNIGGALNVTGNITGTLITATQNSITSIGTLTGLTVSGVTTLTNNTVSTTTSTGALIITGGVGIGGALNVGGNITTTGVISAGTLTGTISTATQNSITSIGTLTSLTVSGATALTSNTASTTSANGALVVTGGVGIGGALNVSGNINGTIGTAIQNSITSIGTLTALTVSGATSLTSNTASSSSSTGALVVTGGVGVGGNLNIGGNLSVTGNISGMLSNLNLSSVDALGLNGTLTSTLVTNWNNVATGIASKVWNAVTWSPELNLFVSVANDTSSAANSVMVSSNGSSWTGKNASSAKNWKSVAWSPDLSLLVAVGADASTANIMTSIDGTTWINKSSPTAGITYNSIIWVRELSLFIAIGYKSATTSLVMTSIDGSTWVARTVPNTLNWNSLTWSKELGILVAVATDASANNIIYSYDGMTWITATNPSASVGWSDVKWSPELGIFVIMPNTSASATYLTSTTGLSWTNRSLTNTPSNYISSIVWVPEMALFIAAQYGSSSFYYSTSGTSWTQFTVPTASQWNSLTWSSELATLVCVNTLSSATYSVITSLHTPSSYLNLINNNQYSNTSALGISANSQLVFKGGLYGGYRWTNTTNNNNANELMRLTKNAYLGINKISPYYNLDVGGTIRGTNIISSGSLTQTLLQNWLSISAAQATTFNYRCVAYSPELVRIVIISDSTSSATAAIIYSSDGVTWNNTNAPANKNWYSVIWIPELRKFVACSATSGSATNQFSYSSDGITWVAVNAPSTNSIRSICWSPELQVLVAVTNNSSVTNSIAYSYDGISWAGTNGAAVINYNSVAWSNVLKLFVAVGDASVSTTNAFAYSSDGITWTAFNAPSLQVWSSICWSRELSTFVTVANNTSSSTNVIAYSTNGTSWTAVNSVVAKNWRTVSWVSELGIFVALASETTASSNSIMYSINGSSWVAGNNLILSNIAWNDMIWITELSQLIIVGPNNTILTTKHKTNTNITMLANNQYSNTTKTSIYGDSSLQYQAGLNSKHIWSTYQNGVTPTELMRLTNSGLGINKSNPIYPLDIDGTSRAKKILVGSSGFTVESTDSTVLAALSDTSMIATSSRFLTLGQSASTNNRAEFEYYHSANGSNSNLLRIGLNGQSNSSRLVFSGDGYLGVGITTAVPFCKLHLGASSSDRLLSLFYSTTDFYGFGANTSMLLNLSKSGYRFYTGSTGSSLGSEIVRITTTGLGIKNVSPAYELDVTGTGNFTTLIASGTITGTTLVGALSTPTQPAIISVGTLTGLTVSGTTSITSSTASSSTSTGALIVTGGVGMGGALNVGGGIYGTLQTPAQTNITSVGTLTGLGISGTTSNGLTITNTNSASNANIRFTNDNRSWEIGVRGSTAASGFQNGLYIYLNTIADFRLQIDTSGNVFIYAPTASTSNTTGALVVTGGIASDDRINAKSFQSNGSITASSWLTTGIAFNQSAATYTNSSAAGTYATQIVHSLQQPTFTSTNAITITDAANFYIANAPLASTNTTITRNWAAWIANGRTLLGASVPAAATLVLNADTVYSNGESSSHGILICAGSTITNQVLYMGTDQTNSTSYLQATKSSAVSNISLNPRGGTVSIGALNTSYGLYVSGTTNLNSTVYVGGTQIFDTSRNMSNIGTIAASGAVTLSNNTVSSSTSTGALIVTGGIGMGGALNVGGGIYGTLQTPAQTNITSVGTLTGLGISGTTSNGLTITNTSTTSLANIRFVNDNRSWEIGVRGSAASAGIQNGLYIYDNVAPGFRLQIDTSGNTFIYASTASTSNTTGALIVTGGIASNDRINAKSFQSNGSITASSWLTTGIAFNQSAATYTNSSAAGTYATQIVYSLQQPTFTSTNAITITDAANFYIANAPLASTNTTITRNWAAWIASGSTLLGASTALANSTLVINANTAVNASATAAHAITICAGSATTNQQLYIGADQTNSTSYLQSFKNNAASTLCLNYRGGSVCIGAALTTSYGLYVADTTNFNAAVYVGGTQVFDTSRNMSNIGTIAASGAVTLSNSTSSSSVSTGALVVTGGIGTSSNINAYGYIMSNSYFYTTGYANAGTGYYLNGVQIVDSNRNLFNIGTISASGVVTLTNTTTASSTTSGSLIVSGGISTTGRIYAGVGFYGTIQTSSQTGISQVGTLSSLIVANGISCDTVTSNTTYATAVIVGNSTSIRNGTNGTRGGWNGVAIPIGNSAIFESDVGGEGSFIAINGDTICMSSPCDNNSLWYYDEDTLQSVWYINASGGLVASSDERLKENIVEYAPDDIMSKINQLTTITYTLKKPESVTRETDKYDAIHHGLSAQQTLTLFPELVDTSGEYYKLNYSLLPLVLVNCVKALSKENDELVTKNTELANRVTDLESQLQDILTRLSNLEN